MRISRKLSTLWLLWTMGIAANAYTFDDFVTDFEWLEPNSTIEIAVGETHQLKYSCTQNYSTVFSESMADNFVHYAYTSSMRYVVDSPTGYSIDEQGNITGLVAGTYEIKVTGLIQKKSGTDGHLKIYVVNEHQEKEPNNSMDTANEFAAKIRCGLYNMSDIDFFKFKSTLKFGQRAKIKVHVNGISGSPFGYKWAGFSGGEMMGGGSIVSSEQECSFISAGDDYLYFEIYFDQSRSQYFQYTDDIVLEIYDESKVVKVTSITLDKSQANISAGESFTLSATVAPDNATNKAVEWSSSNSNVASVANGVVTGVAAGEATITAKSTDGSNVSASCVVTVSGSAKSGKCGENATWELDDEGTLTISGSGEIDDYVQVGIVTYPTRPWHTYANDIKRVVISDGITKIGRGAFYNLPNLKGVDMPNSLVEIAFDAFSECVSVTEINIPSSVRIIGNCAFHRNKNAKWIYSYMEQPVTIDGNVFEYIDKAKCVLYVPEGCIENYKAKSVWNSFDNIIEMSQEKTKSYKLEELSTELIDNPGYLSAGDKVVIYPHNGHENFFSTNILVSQQKGGVLTTWANAGLGELTNDSNIDAALWTLEDASEVGENCYYLVNELGTYWGYQGRSDEYMITVNFTEKVAVKIEKGGKYGGLYFEEQSSGNNYGLNNLYFINTMYNWWSYNGSEYYYDTDENTSFFVRKLDKADKNKAVDLGLSVKWGSYNVGATTPYEYGNYYHWAGTIPNLKGQKVSDWPYAVNGEEYYYTKYTTNSTYAFNGEYDGKSQLERMDDVAASVLGGCWRIPTKEEFEELVSNCTITWTEENGVAGCKVVAKNGNSIFIPASGYSGWSEVPISQGTLVELWTSDLSLSDNAYSYVYHFYSGGAYSVGRGRYDVLAIRPVYDEQNANIVYETEKGVAHKEIVGSNCTCSIDDSVKSFAVLNDVESVNITYKRDFNVGHTWQAWFMPFETTFEEMNKYFDVAEVQGVMFDAKNEPCITFRKMSGGTVKANIPYVVRPISERSSVQVAGNLRKTDNLGTFSIQSATNNFTFGGVLSQTLADQQGWYAINGAGHFERLGSDDHVSAFRIYMGIADRQDSPYSAFTPGNEIKCLIIGEDDVTGLNEVMNTSKETSKTYSVSGQQVDENYKGIVIRDGRKYLVR